MYFFGVFVQFIYPVFVAKKDALSDILFHYLFSSINTVS